VVADNSAELIFEEPLARDLLLVATDLEAPEALMISSRTTQGERLRDGICPGRGSGAAPLARRAGRDPDCAVFVPKAENALDAQPLDHAPTLRSADRCLREFPLTLPKPPTALSIAARPDSAITSVRLPGR
jgi:hypothetical protein